MLGKIFTTSTLVMIVNAEKQEEIYTLVAHYGVTGALAFYQAEDDDEAINYISLKYLNS
jgi:hypothetical protein